jgi:hypothetical protein
MGREWKRCPWREVSDNREIAAVSNVKASAAMSPLMGWPDTYAAWVQQLWQAMDSARADRERQDRREREMKAGH